MKATFELPDQLYRQIQTEATRRGVPVDDLITEVMGLFLQGVSPSQPDVQNAQRSLHDAMKDCCGIVGGSPQDYATNPKYMEGFGE